MTANTSNVSLHPAVIPPATPATIAETLAMPRSQQPMTLGALAVSWDKKHLIEFARYHTGISSIDLDGTPLRIPEDIQRLSATLFMMFGDTYTVTDVMTGDEFLSGRAKILWDRMIDKGWSHERFLLALDGFKDMKHYGKDAWSVGDFLACAPAPDLHEYDWVRREVEFDRTAMSRMRARLIAGVLMWGYR